MEDFTLPFKVSNYYIALYAEKDKITLELWIGDKKDKPYMAVNCVQHFKSDFFSQVPDWLLNNESLSTCPPLWPRARSRPKEASQSLTQLPEGGTHPSSPPRCPHASCSRLMPNSYVIPGPPPTATGHSDNSSPPLSPGLRRWAAGQLHRDRRLASSRTLPPTASGPNFEDAWQVTSSAWPRHWPAGDVFWNPGSLCRWG